ncbi:MAG TPA: type II toxin-antitoxin system RelB/DinJ family antitoxin, partial [Campylobacterales bacterium]|nr:type II toxin-antitoxin system RelB/DinJ family antitoxin [Campylobacterales bacterium]
MKIQTSLRIEQNSLQNAKKILEEMGMNFSEAVNIFVKMIVSHRGLPFEVKLPNNELEELSFKLQKALDEVAKFDAWNFAILKTIVGAIPRGCPYSFIHKNI